MNTTTNKGIAGSGIAHGAYEHIEERSQVMLSYREHNSLFERTGTIKINNVNKVNTGDILKSIDGKTLMGGYVRMQRSITALAAGELPRRSSDHCPLINRNAMGVAHLTFRDSTGDLMWKIPLEHFAYDPEVDSPGEYKQIIFPEGINWAEACIEFCNDDGAVVLDECIEFTAVYIDNKKCFTPCSCSNS